MFDKLPKRILGLCIQLYMLSLSTLM